MAHRRLTALAAVVTMVAAGAGSAPAATNASLEKAAPGAVGAAAPGRCSTSATGLLFTRGARAKAGRLSWTAPRRPAGARLRYAVSVDGRRVTVTSRRSARIAVRVGHRHRFSVAVVRRGRVQEPACRATAALAVPVLPPGAPGRPAAAATGAGLTLTWATSRPGDGAVARYRVFRDGSAVGEVSGPQLTVAAPDPAQPSTFTVAAVDRRGRLSTPSRALTVAPDAPPPTAGSLHAFVLASTGSSFEDLKAHYRQIGAIHATYFECDRASGAIAGRDDPRITTFARLRQVEVYARFDCQSAPVLHRILTEPALRGAWLSAMTGLAVQNGYDGVNVDFESGAPGDRAALTSFVSDLAARMHAIGKKVAVDVSPKPADDPDHPRSGIYDYPALARAADVVFVMAWGIHWSTSAPGPVAGMAWLWSIVHYVNTLPDRGRYVMGTPMYGMDWPRAAGSGAPATALEWSDVAALAARVGVAPAYDATAHEATFAYTDPAGVPHRVWASNAAAVLERMRLFRSNGYRTGVWRLGREDQAMWADPLLAR